MGNYEYFRKIKTNGNLLILLSTYFDRPTSGAKMATCQRGIEFGIFAVKSQFSS